MTVKQAIFTLAPTLERMKKRGFDQTEKPKSETQPRRFRNANSATALLLRIHRMMNCEQELYQNTCQADMDINKLRVVEVTATNR